MKKTLKQAHGNWVQGDRFWNREKDMELFINRIDEGAHTLLVAQRRMGKTSLMREARRLLGDRYTCLFVDLQKSADASDAIVELSLAIKPHTSLWNKTKGVFSNIIGKINDKIEELSIGEFGIKLRAGLTSGNWQEKGNQIFTILSESDKPVLLLMDEVPLMVNRMLKGDDFTITPERRASVDEFMSWLRFNTLEHQGKVRVVISGSIGFEPILRQAGLSATINHIPPLELKPWDIDTAVGCLQALGREYGIDFRNNAEVAMMKRLGCCIPHHVQMFFNHVLDRCKRRGRMEFYPDEVNDLYENEMLGIRGHAELTSYEERLKLVLDPAVFTLALDILTETAKTGCLKKEALLVLQREYQFEGRSARDVQEEILRVLEHDGYISQGKDGYVFESNLLRDWWEKRYGYFHVPVLEREV